MKPNITLREARGKKTLAEVAEAMGLHEASISLYESGKRTPKDYMKVKLANYYNKGILELFFEPYYEDVK